MRPIEDTERIAVPLRRTILKFMLASLGLAAVAGVLAVLLPTSDVMIKIMLTGLDTAVAAVLMIGLTFLLSRPLTRLAALYGMGAVLAQFALWLVLIWFEWWSALPDEEIAVSALVVFLTMLPMLVYLILLKRPGTAVAGTAGAIATLGALILFLVAAWYRRGVWGNDVWWESAWTVGGYGVIVAACLVGAGVGARHAWRWGGGFVAVIAAGLLVYMCWNQPHSDTEEQWLCALTSIASLAGFVNLLLIPKLKGGQRWVRIATIAAAVVTTLLINIFIIGEMFEVDLFGRMISASSIVTACGSLAVVVLMALNRRGAIEPATAALLEMSIACPICNTKQKVPVGPSSCRRCGLRMDIRLEEPRCAQCDYLLYRLESDHCPECGARVRKPAEPAAEA